MTAGRMMRVQAMRYEAEGVLTFELRPLQGGALAPAEAGAHIDLKLANGLLRSYSLCNAPGETHRYVVGVSRDTASRGGSRFMHEDLRPGEHIEVTGPRNHFSLDESAPHTVLVAGGIGITPLWAMAQRLQALGRPWALHYAARAATHAAFADALRALAPDAVHTHFDDECAGRLLDIRAIVAAAPPGAHFYCCGPVPMLRAFEDATAALPPARVHLEYFKAPEPPPPAADAVQGFEVELARSGRVLHVSPGRSILDEMLDAGIDVPYSCMEGICGSCEIRLLAGEADHRDMVLSDAQKKAGESIMVCCSGARSPRLVLDA